ncbi:hypothetical protein BD626DRAFT_634213 [Schizophyllum amplum]|uniref:Uncharacterized protein n=1 Tax=Schizophyllum amplum TaxID=97359 RepID=A0A550C031_9AGAR|nr:hypothetical protein BD626DRAFT_636113 [Auriculariopsis ampla]TRM58044.1 hypothetical protein BD626DRAFT_634298 [Auriculariopsis ampla]TRM58133.1 hypothetical protein BD626DRAFT_634213 [Auriculariopsis ampla]
MCTACAEPDCQLAEAYPMHAAFMQQVQELLHLDEQLRLTQEQWEVEKSRLASLRKATVSWEIAKAQGKTISEWNEEWLKAGGE